VAPDVADGPYAAIRQTPLIQGNAPPPAVLAALLPEHFRLGPTANQLTNFSSWERAPALSCNDNGFVS
jgi:hypothetical protein